MAVKHLNPKHGRPGRLARVKLEGEPLAVRVEARVRRFLKLSGSAAHVVAIKAAGGGLMEDDVTTALFTPGCQAYAGYWNGPFANMTAVRAYAASQRARSFSYTPDGAPGADGIDIEPGDAVPGNAPAFYRQGGRYFYSMASETQQVINALAAAGVPRSAYKLISAHYIGEHMCGPRTCGYPQADATQFTDTYLGRSLDCTLFDATFFGGNPRPNPTPVPNPTPIEEDDPMPVAIPPAEAAASNVGVSFNGPHAYKTIGFLADPGLLGGATVTVRLAFHTGAGAKWAVSTAVLTPSQPKAVISVPSWADGVSFSRTDKAAITLYPNFA